MRRGIVLGAVIFLVFACGGIDDNELKCEEAVAHLEDCCPGVDARRFTCDNEQTCVPSSTPDFYEKASECITSRTCDELKNQGKCDAFEAIANDPYPSNDKNRIQVEACK